MKKVFISVLGGMIALSVLHTGAMATGLNIKQIEENSEFTGEFVVSGTVAENIPVVLQIFKTTGDSQNGKTLYELKSDTIFTDQITAGADGNYVFELMLPEKADESAVYEINAYADGKKLGERFFNFATPDDIKTQITYLCNESEIADADALMNALETNKTKLGLDFAPYNNLSETGKRNIAALIYETKNDNISSVSTADAVSNIRKYAIIAALNDGKVENLFDYSEEIQLANDRLSKVSEWFDNTVVDENIQKKITERLSGKSITTLEEFDDKLLEALILEVVADPDGWGNVKDIMETYADFIGIDINDATQTIYRGLTGVNCESIEALKQAFEQKAGGSNTQGSVSRPTGGGSGGGGSSFGNVGIDNSYNPSPVVETIAENDLTEQPIQFEDCDDFPWAEEAIKTLAQKKIISGRDEFSFAPEDSVSREEFAKIVVEAFGFPQSGKKVAFNDVSEDEWYYTYVSSAYENKIVNGISEEWFGTGEPITRQDICVMLYNALSVRGIQLEKIMAQQSFADSDEISSYAAEAVAVMQTAGIINGTGENMFAPTAYANRAEAAVMIHRLLPSIQTEDMSDAE